MTAMSTTNTSTPPRRRSPGWVPNQHGAWAMLASPLLIGVLAARPTWTHMALAGFWFAGYFAFFATGLWLKSARKPRYLPPVRAYAALTTGLGLAVLALEPHLIRWAPLFAVPLGVGLWSSATRHERSLLSGLATTVGSALMTVAAYDAGAGTDWRRAWLLAAVQAAYFAGTVFYVKSMIRERGDAAFLRLSIGYHAAVAALALAGTAWLGLAGAGLSWWVVGVFVALAARAALVPRLTPAPTPKQIGLGEVAATVAVAVSSLLA